MSRLLKRETINDISKKGNGKEKKQIGKISKNNIEEETTY